MTRLQCALCRVRACSVDPGCRDFPRFCPTLKEPTALSDTQASYLDDAETRSWALAAARTEAAGYGRETRLEEVISFAGRLGVNHIGIAHCIGLLQEAGILQEILEDRGFKVESVCCKVGSIDKLAIGLKEGEKARPGQHEALCNPVGQAKLLDQAGTQLNIVLGLCVGHDTLFFRHSEAPVTVLVVKDRVLGHNPVAALYTSHSYYRRLRGETRVVR
jgi:uncharacterized metal-binding protein